MGYVNVDKRGGGGDGLWALVKESAKSLNTLLRPGHNDDGE